MENCKRIKRMLTTRIRKSVAGGYWIPINDETNSSRDGKAAITMRITPVKIQRREYASLNLFFLTC
jgi:hypothetical protein